jgi:hypothetical protein
VWVVFELWFSSCRHQCGPLSHYCASP